VGFAKEKKARSGIGQAKAARFPIDELWKRHSNPKTKTAKRTSTSMVREIGRFVGVFGEDPVSIVSGRLSDRVEVQSRYGGYAQLKKPGERKMLKMGGGEKHHEWRRR